MSGFLLTVGVPRWGVEPAVQQLGDAYQASLGFVNEQDHLSLYSKQQNGDLEIFEDSDRFSLVIGECFAKTNNSILSHSIPVRSTEAIRLALERIENLRGEYLLLEIDKRFGRIRMHSDAVGGFQLFYLRKNAIFIASDSPTAIKKLAEALRISQCGVKSDYLPRLANAYRIPPNKSIYCDIERLPGGDMLSVSGRERFFTHYRYKDGSIQSLAQGGILDLDSVAELTEAVLSQAVARSFSGETHLSLSGGADSRLLLFGLNRCNVGPLKTVNVSFPGMKCDEQDIAAGAASACGAFHRRVRFDTGNYWDHIEEMSKILESPPFSTLYHLWITMQENLGAGNPYWTGGWGGDEVFIGHPIQVFSWPARWLRSPRNLRSVWDNWRKTNTVSSIVRQAVTHHLKARPRLFQTRRKFLTKSFYPCMYTIAKARGYRMRKPLCDLDLMALMSRYSSCMILKGGTRRDLEYEVLRALVPEQYLPPIAGKVNFDDAMEYRSGRRMASANDLDRLQGEINSIWAKVRGF